jgi:hypothetical protein
MSRWTRLLLTTVFLTVLGAGCSIGDVASLPAVWLSFQQLFSQNQTVVQQMQAAYTGTQLQAALFIVAESLLGRDPTQSELTEAGTSFSSYQTVVQSYLNSPTFQTQELVFFNNFYTTAYTSIGSNSSIDYNEPANLATYLIVNDIDFRQVLTATYCVQNQNNVLTQVACSTFASNPSLAATNAAGVLTTQAFLSQTTGPFNLHRANAAFQLFACRNFLLSPDMRDPGLSVDEISGSIKTFNCNNGSDCNPICYTCHKNMNSRASLFYNYDLNGLYDPNPSPSVQAQTDTGNPSTVADLLVSPAQPAYFGKAVSTLQQYGTLFSQNRDFRDCLAQILTNQMLGGSPTTALEPQLQDIRDHIDLNGYDVKKILLEIAGHPAFVNN